MSTTKPRYTVSVDDDLFDEIEKFRVAGKYVSRSAATVDLLKLGLEKLQEEQDKPRQAAHAKVVRVKRK